MKAALNGSTSPTEHTQLPRSNQSFHSLPSYEKAPVGDFPGGCFLEQNNILRKAFLILRKAFTI